MNDKANIQSLTQKLASAHGLTKDEAESFVREFFSLVSDALDKDRMVKVKGLGTFRVIDVEDRDSVDVNTGERITISGHKKVTFTPDASLKEEVNKPFADFETTILVDDPVEEVESVASDENYDHLDTIHELYGRPVVAPEPEQPVIEVSPDADPEDTEQEILEAAEPVETEPEVSSEEAQEVSEIEAEALEEVSENSAVMEESSEELLVEKADQDVERSSEVFENPEPELQEATSVEPESESDAEQLYDEPVPEPTEQDADEPDAKEEDKPAESPMPEAIHHNHRHHSHHKHHEKSSNTALKWISLIFLLIIMGIGAFVLNMYYPGIFQEPGEKNYDEPVLQQESTIEIPGAQEAVADAIPEKPVSSQATAETVQPEAKVKTESVKVDLNDSQTKASQATTQASQPSTASQASSTTQKLTDGKNYVIDGTLATHTIKSGETLRIISEKYYGSRNFSSKIVEHNKATIKNPDNVPAGTKINIPRLVEK